MGPRGAPGTVGPQGLLGPPGETGPREPMETSGGEEVGVAQPAVTDSFHFRWNKVLKTLSFEVVRPWVCQFVAYLYIIRVLSAKEKMLLMQYLGVAYKCLWKVLGKRAM